MFCNNLVFYLIYFMNEDKYFYFIKSFCRWFCVLIFENELNVENECIYFLIFYKYLFIVLIIVWFRVFL